MRNSDWALIMQNKRNPARVEVAFLATQLASWFVYFWPKADPCHTSQYFAQVPLTRYLIISTHTPPLSFLQLQLPPSRLSSCLTSLYSTAAIASSPRPALATVLPSPLATDTGCHSPNNTRRTALCIYTRLTKTFNVDSSASGPRPPRGKEPWRPTPLPGIVRASLEK